MNIALWILQALLALFFIWVGGMKLFSPISSLEKSFTWIKETRPFVVRYIGACEALGSLGLILPGVTHILTDLTIVAALGLCLVMIYASIFHAKRKEFSNIIFNSVIFLLAFFVAFGRFALVRF
ncbi:DoxX family protein [Ktedonospora formicarum]|nr:DoxX family protein [Ktedonospora formicarum]